MSINVAISNTEVIVNTWSNSTQTIVSIGLLAETINVVSNATTNLTTVTEIVGGNTTTFKYGLSNVTLSLNSISNTTTFFVVPKQGSNTTIHIPYYVITLGPYTPVIPSTKLTPIGVNLFAGGSATAYVEGFPIFKNRIREAFGFITPGSPYPGSLCSLSANGWPSSNFEAVMIGAANGDIATQASWTQGNWSCGFIGNGSEIVSGVNGATVSNIVVNNNGGPYTTFTLTISNNGGFKVNNVTQVSNVFAYLPEYSIANNNLQIDNVYNANAFTNEILAHYKNIRQIRAMQWTNVIRNGYTMTGTNRATPNNTQCAYAGLFGALGTNEGVPHEWIASLCVASNCDMWLTVGPVFDSTFTYITSLAESLYSFVPPGIGIYIEVGNELWNGQRGGDAGPTFWESKANTFSGYSTYTESAYLGYQLHNIAEIFRSVFGSRFGTDVRLVLAWQQGGNGRSFQWNLYQYYVSQGWNISNDLWATAQAPYFQTGLSSGSTPTVATVLADLETSASNWIADEGFWIMGLKWGLYPMTYEGGAQINNEQPNISNISNALMNTGMTNIYGSFFQALANSGCWSYTHFADGVCCNFSWPNNNYSPIDQLDYSYTDLLNGGSPIWTAIQNQSNGWIAQRNVVNGPGSKIPGNCYYGSNSGANATFQSATNAGVPNYPTSAQNTFIVNCTTNPGTYSLNVWFNNTGSAGTTGLEYGGINNPYTIIAPTVTVPSGSSNVAIADINLVLGMNYICLGHPNTYQPSIQVCQLTFNAP